MKIEIYEDITSTAEAAWWGGFSLGQLTEKLDAMDPDDKNIDLEIHSNGGSVSEGWAIIDKLRSTGKEISATGYGLVASMALSVFLAASKRTAPKGTTFLAHYPWCGYTGGNADEIQKTVDELRAEQEKLLDFYVERTGCDRERMDALMAEDRIISAEEALEYGFIEAIDAPLSASAEGHRGLISFRRPAFNNAKPFKSSMAKDKNKIAEAFAAFASALGFSVKMENAREDQKDSYVLTSADGQQLTIEKEEGEAPEVGDAASPDGTFVMGDGSTIVVADGLITEIKPAEAPAEAPEGAEGDGGEGGDDKDARIAELEAEVERLRQENEELKKQLGTSDEARKAAIEAQKKAEGAQAKAEKDLSEMRSKYKPAQRGAKNLGQASGSVNDQLAALRERLKDKK